VAHVREEAGLHLVGAAEVAGLLVELRVEGEDAAVRVLQLLVEAHELVLSALELVEGPQELLVVLPHLLEGILGIAARQLRRHVSDGLRRHERCRSGQDLLEPDLRAAAGLALHLEPVHEPPGPEEPEAHARLRAVVAGEDVLEVRDARPLVGDLHDEHLRSRGPFHAEEGAADLRIAEDVARDLRNRGGDARLVLVVEAEERRDLAGALAREHHVVLEADLEREEGHVHGETSRGRATMTVTSSRPRAQSR
jgi:hypothetical protein